ncbi:DUF4352 domain-containing protein [Streptomyces sp. NPDC001663]|uniref:DUF4352 domain-containing protein n=1 Tax=Streptomyces sp. NPDC001663 TaxID=3364597 RepID=UPI0036A699B1
MSQQYPQQPGWQAPQQPGWGAPQQQYPQQPGWGPPPPQPPKKSPVGKILGFGCLGVVALVVVLGVIGAALGGGSDSDDKATGAKSSASAGTKQDTAKDADDTSSDDSSGTSSDSKPQAPVKFTAKKTAFAKSILADSSNYTSVLVTVTNNGDDKVSVNPLYFTITDSKGTKHTAELAVDDKQIDTVDLAPGENISGTVTGKGNFTPKYVTFTEDLLGDETRINVS